VARDSVEVCQAVGDGSPQTSTRCSQRQLNGAVSGALLAGLVLSARPQTTLVSMGGCITSALTGASAVEVVDAVLGTVST
jgi:hypothetical protein